MARLTRERDEARRQKLKLVWESHAAIAMAESEQAESECGRLLARVAELEAAVSVMYTEEQIRETFLIAICKERGGCACASCAKTREEMATDFIYRLRGEWSEK